MIVIAIHEHKAPSDAPKEKFRHITPDLSTDGKIAGIQGREERNGQETVIEPERASKGDNVDEAVDDGMPGGECWYHSGALPCIDLQLRKESSRAGQFRVPQFLLMIRPRVDSAL